MPRPWVVRVMRWKRGVWVVRDAKPSPVVEAMKMENTLRAGKTAPKVFLSYQGCGRATISAVDEVI